jgi:FkbM family methyltransferase
VSARLKRWHHEQFKHVFEIKEVYNYVVQINGKMIKSGNCNILCTNYSSDIKDITIYLRRRTSDFAVYNQIIVKREYDWALKKIKPDTKIIIDAGANIGLFSVLFSKHLKSCNIISLEPEPGNFEILDLNIKLNNCNKVLTVKGGLWNKTQKLSPSNDFRDGREWSFRLKESEVKEENTIEVFSLNDLIQRFEIDCIDLLKMDIEGSEFQILNEQALPELLEKVKMIAVEIHSDESRDPEIIIQFLEKCGLVISLEAEYTVGERII